MVESSLQLYPCAESANKATSAKSGFFIERRILTPGRTHHGADCPRLMPLSILVAVAGAARGRLERILAGHHVTFAATLKEVRDREVRGLLERTVSSPSLRRL